jgi:hypothetical protein
MGRDLCKLRAQITFDSDGMAALKLRVPEAKILTLWLCRRRNGDSVPLRKRFLRCLSFPLRFQKYGLRKYVPDWLGTYLQWW